jgi:hypothetical protein
MSDEDDRKAHDAFVCAALSGLCARERYDELTNEALDGTILVADAMMIARARRRALPPKPSYKVGDRVQCIDIERGTATRLWNGRVAYVNTIEEYFDDDGARVAPHYIVAITTDNPARAAHETLRLRLPEHAAYIRPHGEI